MDARLRQDLLRKWERYFPGVELPVAYWWTDAVSEADRRDSRDEAHCVVRAFARVREGHTFVYGKDSPGCRGWARYTGFSRTLRPGFEWFLSCGIPGEIEGERYKQSPELVTRYLEARPPFEAPGRWLVFKRWDRVAPDERPFAVICFAPPDVLSGLFALANFDRADPHGVVAPMGSGCSQIVAYPWEEARAPEPRCVLGMFDVSARPAVRAGELTFTVPFARFERMVANMDESFLITRSWDAVRARIRTAAASPG